MQKELKQLGFSDNQIKVYLALLDLGLTRVGPIITQTQLPRQTVYNTLAELENQDLIFQVIQSGRKHWQTAEPKVILKKMKSKFQLAQELIPQIINQRDQSKHLAEIKVYAGLDGFMTMHINNLQNQPKKTQVNIIGAGGQQWIELAKEAGFFNKYESLRIDKKIKQNIIAYENQRQETKKFIDKHYLKQLPSERKKFKFLPKEFYSPVGIQIWQDKIDLIVYSEDPIIFEIKNKDLVKSFTNYFNLLWKMAKK